MCVLNLLNLWIFLFSLSNLTISLPLFHLSTKCGFNYNVHYVYDYSQVSTLRSVQTIIRHGARNQLSSYPNDPYAGNTFGVKGFGQLLPSGGILAYQLGEYMRNRYHGYLNKSYTIEEIFVQSSSFDRTIMTAQYVLAGLYKISQAQAIIRNLQWQPIPVRAIPLPLDNKIAQTQRQNCEKYEKVFNIYKESLPMLLLNKQNQDLFAYMTLATGANISDFESVYEIADTLLVQCQNGLILPEWAKKVFPTRTDLFVKVELEIYTATKELARLESGPLISEIVTNFKVEIGTANWTGTELMPFHLSKMFMYSGHDNTISGLLNALGVYDNEPPLYTSALMFELHALNPLLLITNDNNYEIKLFYKKQKNMKALELKFPDCTSPCTLQKFQDVYNWLLISPDELITECENV